MVYVTKTVMETEESGHIEDSCDQNRSVKKGKRFYKRFIEPKQELKKEKVVL